MKKRSVVIIFLFLLYVAALPASAQDAAEVKWENTPNKKMQGEHPLTKIAREKKVVLKKELDGVHPRVYLTQGDIDKLKEKAKKHPELFATALSRVRAVNTPPTPPPAQERRVQNEVGLGIPEAALAYKITGDKKYLAAAKLYLDTACEYNTWGYEYSKPNIDLAAGHLLYGFGWGYDLLYHDLTAAEKEKYRAKMIKQARLLYNFFKPREGRMYTYSQNHTSIPVSGLAVTAYALLDDPEMKKTGEAQEWADFSRAIFDRVLATHGTDGYFYESMEYWIFSTPWLVHYMDAHYKATGEDLYKGVTGLQLSHKYVSHITLPGAEFNFDFGDIYDGPLTRERKGDNYHRERINGNFRTNYNILYNLASRYGSGEAQGVADWLKKKGQVNAEEFWTFIWYDDQIKPVPIEQQPTAHYFKDHGVVIWRDSWNDDATAFAFKAGPPEGHDAYEHIKKFSDWRLSSGHAHPDAGGFIIWSKGRYLTGDSGYAGLPLTIHHNTLLFDGKGQAKEGKGHNVFAEVDYAHLNAIVVKDVKFDSKGLSLWADITSAYEPEVGVKKFLRKFTFTAPGEFLVEDDVVTAKPMVVSSILHSDTKIEGANGSFIFEPGKPQLSVGITSAIPLTFNVEPNNLTSAGRPGSVDKGEAVVRGVRLITSTRDKVSKVKFQTKLTIK